MFVYDLFCYNYSPGVLLCSNVLFLVTFLKKANNHMEPPLSHGMLHIQYMR